MPRVRRANSRECPQGLCGWGICRPRGGRGDLRSCLPNAEPRASPDQDPGTSAPRAGGRGERFTSAGARHSLHVRRNPRILRNFRAASACGGPLESMPGGFTTDSEVGGSQFVPAVESSPRFRRMRS
jgi:hypothetical protein